MFATKSNGVTTYKFLQGIHLFGLNLDNLIKMMRRMRLNPQEKSNWKLAAWLCEMYIDFRKKIGMSLPFSVLKYFQDFITNHGSSRVQEQTWKDFFDKVPFDEELLAKFKEEYETLTGNAWQEFLAMFPFYEDVTFETYLDQSYITYDSVFAGQTIDLSKPQILVAQPVAIQVPDVRGEMHRAPASFNSPRRPISSFGRIDPAEIFNPAFFLNSDWRTKLDESPSTPPPPLLDLDIYD